MVTGSGTFFDGSSSRRRSVEVTLGGALEIRDEDGSLITWPLDELEHHDGPDGVLRLGRAGDAMPARLEIADPDLARAIDERAETVDRSGAREVRGRWRVVAWSVAAVASLVGVGVFGVPALADRLAPVMPLGFERWVGDNVAAQVPSLLNDRKSTNFVCGAPGTPGRRALDRLVTPLADKAALQLPITVQVVRRSEPNAIALPGGHVFVFSGLIDRMAAPDQLAAVIAHEIGHVAHRDGMRSMIESAGLGFLFGMVLGDFAGGWVTVGLAQAAVSARYSREVEARADLYGLELMVAAGADPQALAGAFERIAAAIGGGNDRTRLFDSHPDIASRIERIRAMPSGGRADPLLDAEGWAALRSICRE